MLQRATYARPYRELLAAYRASAVPHAGEKLRFAGVGDRDVYNITAPFADDGALVIAGRVEDRTNEHSTTHFFLSATVSGCLVTIPRCLTSRIHVSRVSQANWCWAASR